MDGMKMVQRITVEIKGASGERRTCESAAASSTMKKLFNQRKDTKQALSDEVNGAADAASGAATAAASDAANAANAAASSATGAASAAGAAVTAAASSEPPSVPSKSKTPSLVREGALEKKNLFFFLTKSLVFK
jgi:hypothetical protein